MAQAPNNSNQNPQLQQAIALHRSGKINDAKLLYKKLLNFFPKNTVILSNLGAISLQQGQFDDALKFIDKSLALNPNQPLAYNNRGNTLRHLQRLNEAVESFKLAVQLNPHDAESFNNLANTLRELKHTADALNYYDQAIALRPDFIDAYFGRGMALRELKRLDEAITSYDRAIELKNDFAEAYNNRGNILKELKRLTEALANYDKALTLKPSYTDAHNNRGVALQDLKQLTDSLASFDRAIALNPGYAEAYKNRGNVLKDLKRIDEAVVSYEKALQIKPSFEFLLGDLIHTKMYLSNWDRHDEQLDQLKNQIAKEGKVSTAFPVLALIDDPALQKKCAEIHTNVKHPTSNELPKIAKYPKHQKIRIGYFSADYYNHATMHLMAEMFECHDKTKFELIAFSFGPDKQDEWKARARKCFDQFIEVGDKSNIEIAQLARALEIDIAIDLKGFTTDSRTSIFSYRTAPIQVNYLGYPGTMGADYIDYIIADQTLIPEDKQQYYHEKIAYLPNCYQVNIKDRAISESVITRAQVGLPENAFVFCSFNNNYKITPDTFDGWMRILSKVENSVLWIFKSQDSAINNLKKEAELRGVNSERLIFASFLPIEEHLKRIQLADLFLDTLPCNAHTTASDALRVGLPIVTQMGSSFASRVAASLLNAVDLPEMITTSQEAYEALAIDLAKNPKTLNKIRAKLLNQLPTSTLYDTPLFTKHIESIYEQMYDTYQKDSSLDHLYAEVRKAL